MSTSTYTAYAPQIRMDRWGRLYRTPAYATIVVVVSPTTFDTVNATFDATAITWDAA